MVASSDCPNIFKLILALPQVYAQDQLANMHYKRGDFTAALELLDKALNTCLQRSVGRLPYYLLQSHKAVVLSLMGSHDKSHAILDEYIPTLHTATTNPLGDFELIETERVVSHLLVISFHNLAVQLTCLQHWDDAIEITARVLSLMDSGMHAAQPICRHFVHAHCASLRMPTAGSTGIYSYTSDRKEDRGEKGGRPTKSGSLDASMDSDFGVLNSGLDSRKEGRWNKWLALAGQGRAIAPLIIEIPAPEVGMLGILANVPSRGFKTHEKVLDAALEQFPKLESMETCPDEVLGTVSRAILHFAEEGSYSNSEVAAAERYEQIEKLLDEDLFEFSQQLRWDVQVFGIMAKAYFLYTRIQNYETALQHGKTALDIAIEQDQGSGYHVALCQLFIGACLLRAGNHDDAFDIGKEALKYCHGLSDEELQVPAMRIQMEDVLVGASHLMALAHIFLGNGKVALKLSKIAKEHIKNTSYYSNKTSLQYTQMSRVYEITMSMNELVKDKNKFQTTPKRGALWVDKISSIVPTKFVPGALHRNLPELYPDRTHNLRGSRPISNIDFTLPSEEVVHEIVNKDAAVSRQEILTETESSKIKRRYSWTGRYASAASGEDDHPHIQDSGTIASISMATPLIRQSSAESFLENPRAGAFSAVSSIPSRVQTGFSSQPNSAPRISSTPYGQLATNGLTPPQDPSLTGHQFVDELMYGKEEMRRLYASTPSSNVYFAKVYAKARDQNSLLLDPLAKVVPEKRYVVGDHQRPQVGGPRAPASFNHSSSANKKHLMRDWGPDPTLDLRRFSAVRLGTRSGRSKGRAKTALGVHQHDAQQMDADVSGSTAHESLDSFEQARRELLKMDMNEVRVMKHVPFDSVVRQSAMSCFFSRSQRHTLMEELDKHNLQTRAQSVSGKRWPALQLAGKSSDGGHAHSDARSSVSRPWHWSHAPEPSPFLHRVKGQKRSNEHYRVLPYGQNLTPAGKLAYGTNGMPALGFRCMQTVQVSQSNIVASAALSRKPEYSSVSTVSSRSLSGFC